MPNNLTLYIRDDTDGTTNFTENNTVAKASSQMSQPTQQGIASSIKLKGLAVATTLGQGAFQYVSSNIGRYTGNTSNQTKFNNIMQGIQFGSMALFSPTLAFTTLAIQGVSWALDENYRVRTERVQLSQSQARAGYTSTKDIVSRRNT